MLLASLPQRRTAPPRRRKTPVAVASVGFGGSWAIFGGFVPSLAMACRFPEETSKDTNSRIGAAVPMICSALTSRDVPGGQSNISVGVATSWCSAQGQ